MYNVVKTIPSNIGQKIDTIIFSEKDNLKTLELRAGYEVLIWGQMMSMAK